jgi:alkylation response protein AidB-like acyl-CoA dehydrogenase
MIKEKHSMETITQTKSSDSAVLSTLPGDDVRQIMWRMTDRFDLQMVVQSARSTARGPVARLVAEGGRNTHEWTEEKSRLFEAFDDAGITSIFMDPEYGGFIVGPKNMAMGLAAFELSWVDAGSATCGLANNLALSPIHEKGTEEQRAYYMSRSVPPQPGEDRRTWRGAFALTEPLPYVGVDTGVVSGKMRISQWEDGGEPMLHIDKRGRFITNMGFADFVSAVVTSDDERIKGSCMVILEKTDEGLFDRGVPTKKMVHQLSSTRDPVFSLKIPAHRIIGGYTVKDGVIVPNFNHGEVIEAVFRRTRVTVALMTSAKLLSAVEPILRYQRGRFRGGEAGEPGTPRYELGLQQKEDSLQRLLDIWATGEAGASLGFATALMFDNFDPIEKEKDAIFASQGIKGTRAKMKALRKAQKDAIECLQLSKADEGKRDNTRYQELTADTMVQFLLIDSVSNVLCPACKLWNTGNGTNMMREAVSLMGGYGITEDCPGFIGQKWMDAQLEATYEGPEAVQRRQLSITMINELFLAQFSQWIEDLNALEGSRLGTGAGALANAMDLWLWTLRHLLDAKDSEGKVLYHNQRQGVSFPLADALCWLLSSRYFILDLLELEDKGPQNPVLAEGIAGLTNFYSDMSHAQSARAASEAARICSELLFGYNSPACDDECKQEMAPFWQKRAKLDISMAGARMAKDRAARALAQVMIPEALDYPQ